MRSLPSYSGHLGQHVKRCWVLRTSSILAGGDPIQAHCAGLDDNLVLEPLRLYFGQFGLSGPSGAPTGATFSLGVPPGDKLRASQASQPVVVWSFPQPFHYDLEDPGHLQLPRILRNILSHFSRPRVSMGDVKT